jgi:hypothetical protein
VQRDPRLRGLSADHHHALVLARRAARGEVDADALRATFTTILQPHFAIEEELLLPPLGAGDALVVRTLADHHRLRALATSGDAPAFAALLDDHVRFEERELFPACEARLPAEVLDAVSRAAPSPRAPRDPPRT